MTGNELYIIGMALYLHLNYIYVVIYCRQMEKLITNTVKFIDIVLKDYQQISFALKTQLITFRSYIETYNITSECYLTNYIHRLQTSNTSARTKTETSKTQNENSNMSNFTHSHLTQPLKLPDVNNVAHTTSQSSKSLKITLKAKNSQGNILPNNQNNVIQKMRDNVGHILSMYHRSEYPLLKDYYEEEYETYLPKLETNSAR